MSHLQTLIVEALPGLLLIGAFVILGSAFRSECYERRDHEEWLRRFRNGNLRTRKDD